MSPRPHTHSESTSAGHGDGRDGADGPQHPHKETEGSRQVTRLFEMTDDLLAVIEHDGRLSLLNPAWEQHLGWPRQEMIGRPIRDLVHPEDVEQTLVLTLDGIAGSLGNGNGDGAGTGTDSAAAIGIAGSRPEHIVNFTSRFRHRDGSWRWLLWSARSDGRQWFAAAKDVTDRMGLERQALHDPLTSLPNRLLLMDRTRRALRRLHRTGGLIALLFIDLDRFKDVNDNLGHAVGDDLLISAAKRLEDVVRENDTVARLGGDEFVVLAEDMEGDTEVLALAERVLAALQEPAKVGSAVVSLRASVGISLCRSGDRDPEDLLREADVAMYRAKGSGGRGLGLFDDALRSEMAQRLELEAKLRHALPRHELRLLYQPAVKLSNGEPLGCEALLRWHPHDGVPMAPRQFLHLAEDSNLIAGIGEWVLQTTCMQASAWRREGLPLIVSANVSARGLAQPDIAERIREALIYSELPPQALCLEVNEAAILRDPDRARATLAACKSVGVCVALDNFGAGHSSLSLPSTLELDAIKIDRSLIGGFEQDRAKRAIVTAATAMAREAGLTAIAVGIESERQLELARELGCAVGQGNLLCPPTPPEHLSFEAPLQHVRSQAPWRPTALLSRIPHHNHHRDRTA